MGDHPIFDDEAPDDGGEVTTSRKRTKAKAAKAPSKAVKRRKAQPKAKAPETAKATSKPRKPRKATKQVEFDDYGFRSGSKKAIAAAMYASDDGATLGEVKAKTDSIQFNVIGELEAKGFTVKRTLEDGDGRRKVT